MSEAKLARVQQQPRCTLDNFRRCVQGVAQYRMAERLQMNPQLVSSPGQGLELDAGRVGAWVDGSDPPASLAGLAVLMVYDLARAVRPIGGDRQVDQGPAVTRIVMRPHLARDNRNIALADRAIREGNAQLALHLRAAAHHAKAGSRHVEPMHDQGIRVHRLRPRRKAILLIGAASRHAQHAGGFVQHDEVLVHMDDKFR